jgi:hypothetical protein
VTKSLYLRTAVTKFLFTKLSNSTGKQVRTDNYCISLRTDRKRTSGKLHKIKRLLNLVILYKKSGGVTSCRMK